MSHTRAKEQGQYRRKRLADTRCLLFALSSCESSMSICRRPTESLRNVRSFSKASADDVEETHLRNLFTKSTTPFANAAFHVSGAVYRDENHWRNHLETDGWNLVSSWVAGASNRDRAELWKKDHDCILGFKGSDSWDDWFNNIDIRKETYKGLRDTHSGFIDEFDPLFLQLEASEPKLSATCPGNLIVTGHSLGGAMASMFAAVVNAEFYLCSDYRKQDECMRDASCYWNKEKELCHLVACPLIVYSAGYQFMKEVVRDCEKYEGCSWMWGEWLIDVDGGQIRGGLCIGLAGEIELNVERSLQIALSQSNREYSHRKFSHVCRRK